MNKTVQATSAVTEHSDHAISSSAALPVILIVLVMTGIAFEHWSTMRTLDRSAIFTNVMNDIKDNLNQAVIIGKAAPKPPNEASITEYRSHIKAATKSLSALILGGELYDIQINAIRDEHLREEAILLSGLLEEITPHPNETIIQLEVSKDLYTQVNAVIYDMSEDIEEAIEEDRTALTQTFVITYIIIASILILFLLHARRTRLALSDKNEELEAQVKKRTSELEDAINKNNNQMLELAQSNVRATLFKRSLEELREADEQLIMDDNVRKFLERVLSSVTHTLGGQGGGIYIQPNSNKEAQFICQGHEQKENKIDPNALFNRLLKNTTPQNPCICVRDLSQDAGLRFIKETYPQLKSLIAITLSLNNQYAGAIYIFRSEELLPFSSSDETLLLMFQPHVQHAIERNDLLSTVRKTNEALAGDITARKKVEEALTREKREQQDLIKQLQGTQEQLLQSEKMASIGQLAAGVAHEINNPVGYINSNLGSLIQYINDLLKLIEAYEQSEEKLPQDSTILESIKQLKDEVDLDFLKEDIRNLLDESQEGVGRVKQIVQDLKDFSHVDESEWQWADLHKGLDSTLNIAHNEIKYRATVRKEYGEIPPVECVASQLNQVFMNILVNAAHAIESSGEITIRTGVENENVWIQISDTGKGIEQENLNRIFDPFFTTKPVGKGTGLGLAIVHSWSKHYDKKGWLVLLYLMMIVIPHAVVMVAVLGILDNWTDFLHF